MLGALAYAGLCSGHFPCLRFLTSLVVQVQILQCNATTPALWFSLPRDSRPAASFSARHSYLSECIAYVGAINIDAVPDTGNFANLVNRGGVAVFWPL